LGLICWREIPCSARLMMCRLDEPEGRVRSTAPVASCSAWSEDLKSGVEMVSTWGVTGKPAFYTQYKHRCHAQLSAGSRQGRRNIKPGQASLTGLRSIQFVIVVSIGRHPCPSFVIQVVTDHQKQGDSLDHLMALSDSAVAGCPVLSGFAGPEGPEE